MGYFTIPSGPYAGTSLPPGFQWNPKTGTISGNYYGQPGYIQPTPEYLESIRNSSPYWTPTDIGKSVHGDTSVTPNTYKLDPGNPVSYRPILETRNTFLQKLTDMYNPDQGASYGHSPLTQQVLGGGPRASQMTTVGRPTSFASNPAIDRSMYASQWSNQASGIRGQFAQYQAAQIGEVLKQLLAAYGQGGEILGTQLGLQSAKQLQKTRDQAARNSAYGQIPVLGPLLSSLNL